MTEHAVNSTVQRISQLLRGTPEPAAYRVLIVDDEDALRTGLVQFLRPCGYETVGARNGDEALDAVRDGKFELMLERHAVQSRSSRRSGASPASFRPARTIRSTGTAVAIRARCPARTSPSADASCTSRMSTTP
jgi:hypothetical protein